ncbi:MAG TPA: tail fiber domain-containing protein [Casimicrobiaceae bacterium]|nr:tail fiber domain-containing protein [Casimicrobiaceae bacterium]
MSRLDWRSMRVVVFAALALFAVLAANDTLAQVPDKLNYQGRLTDPGGAPLTTSVPMVFKLYTVPSGGAAIYTETQTVSVAGGVFNVAIGSVTPLNLPFDVPYYLGVKVGADAEMTPRQAVLAVAYAQRADAANGLATGGAAGQVLVGTGAVPAWSDSLSLNGNLALVNPSTAVAGNVMKGSSRFIHNFGSGNTFVGEDAGNFTLTGVENSAGGGSALTSNTTGFRNVAGGYRALASNQTGSNNAASGAYALEFNVAGTQNTAVGAFAMRLNTTDDNTGVGYQALYNNAGYSNTATGSQALANNTTGNFNTATGYTALYLNDSGKENTAIGSKALAKNTTGNFNTAGGSTALYNNSTGNWNTASGALALLSNTVGFGNSAYGFSALLDNVDGFENTAIGFRALEANNAANNTALGSQAMLANASGTDNTAIGFHALNSNTSGAGNTAVGSLAMLLNLTGVNNVAVGSRALEAGSGNRSVAIGNSALMNNQGGNGSVAIGNGALMNVSNGFRNIAIGDSVGDHLNSGSQNIYIGNYSNASPESNTIRIGFTQDQTYIAGIRYATVGGSSRQVYIDDSEQLGVLSSSRRSKEDIADMDSASSALLALRPVTFHYKSDSGSTNRRLQYGLIAEEVAEVFPELVAWSRDGQIETVMYQFLPPMLLNEYQKQQRIIEAQAAAIATQAERMAELERDRERQFAEIAALREQALDVAALKRQVAELVQLARLQQWGLPLIALETPPAAR